MSSEKESVKGGITFIWKIENFSICTQKKNEKIISPTFPSELSSILLSRCSLRLCPRGSGEDETICVTLHREQICVNVCVDIAIRYTISLLRNDGSIHISKEFESTTIGDPSECAKLLTRDEIIKQKELLLPRDTLTIHCHIWGNLPHIGVMAESYCARTRFEMERYSSIFILKEVSTCCRKQYSIGIYSVPSGKPMLDMHLWSTGEASLENCVKINICDKRQKKNKPMFVKCKISILGVEPLGEYMVFDENLFQPREKDQVWHFPSFINRNNVASESTLPNDELCLQYEFSFSEGKETTYIEEWNTIPSAYQHLLDNHTSQKNKSSPSGLGEQLLQMYTEKRLCDVKLEVDGAEFSAHKNILSARSSVFCAMFERDMKEKQSGVVKITDVDEITLSKFLHFIYTDNIEDLKWDDATKLYSTADKYQVIALKEKCVAVLTSNMSVGNVCSALALADIHQDTALKEAAQRFVRTNAKEVFASDEWDTFMENNSQLAAKTMKQAWPM